MMIMPESTFALAAVIGGKGFEVDGSLDAVGCGLPDNP
jgi:hypothetical protein